MKRYANLTNGIEAMDDGDDWRFVRIQSTACEQRRWSFIIEDLDHDLLMNLARGELCTIYDFGHQGVPRALWQGVEWVRYALTRAWLGRETRAIVRGECDATGYFREQYKQLSPRAAKKLAYYRHFVNTVTTESIRLRIMGGVTEHDGDYDWYARQLRARG